MGSRDLACVRLIMGQRRKHSTFSGRCSPGMQECLASRSPMVPSFGGRRAEGWSQGHQQQAVGDVVLSGAQLSVGAAPSVGWMHPCQKRVLGKGLADAVGVPTLSRGLP